MEKEFEKLTISPIAKEDSQKPFSALSFKKYFVSFFIILILVN